MTPPRKPGRAKDDPPAREPPDRPALLAGAERALDADPPSESPERRGGEGWPERSLGRPPARPRMTVTHMTEPNPLAARDKKDRAD